MSDPRFARLTTDPRFRRPKQKQLKVEIDDRFKSVLEGDDFGGNAGKKGGRKTDKYGRQINSTHSSDQLKRFYKLRSPSPDAGEGSSSGPKPFIDYARGEATLESSGSEDEESESEQEEEELELGGKRRRKLPGVDVSDDEDDETEDGEDHLDIDLSENSDGDEVVAPANKGKGKAKSAFGPEADIIPASDFEEEDDELIDPTTRLAIVNLDWDNLRAIDLFSIFQSFLNASSSSKKGPIKEVDGKLLNVRIYPSEFGKERMEREEIEGPAVDVFKKAGRSGVEKKGRRTGRVVDMEDDDEEDDDDENELDLGEEDEDDDEDEAFDEEAEDSRGSEDDGAGDDDEDAGVGEKFELEDMGAYPDPSDSDDNREEDVDMDKLRAYQLERLRYYYAIATFSTPSAAAHILSECNGTEFERTANILDMSFVPEEMDFEDEWTDEAREEMRGYKGVDFVTDALRHSKVKLTWDQDDPNRLKLLRRPLSRKEIDEDDFKAYLAASSDEEDSASDMEAGDASATSIAKKAKKKKMKEKTEALRQLLLNGGNGDEDVWGKHSSAKLPDMGSDDDRDMEITFTAGLSGKSAAGFGGEEDEENMTTLQKYQRRMKEKKDRKKEKKELKAGSRTVDGEQDEEAGGKVEGRKARKSVIVEEDDFFGMDGDPEELVVAPKPAKEKSAASKAAPSKAKTLLPTLDVPDETRHFSLTDILKAEKDEGKRKRKRVRKSKHGEERELELGEQGFKIDVKDKRFEAIHREPAFAIDPSDPHFKKTKAMTELLDERAKRRQEAAKAGPREKISVSKPQIGILEPEKSVHELVASVKRKLGGDENGDDKKKRKRSRK